MENSSSSSFYLQEKQTKEYAPNLAAATVLLLLTTTLPIPAHASVIDDHSSLSKSDLVDDLLEASAKKAAIIDSVMGKYAHVKTSSEDFARRKQEDLSLE